MAMSIHSRSTQALLVISSCTLKKLLIIMNSVTCYFSICVLLQGNHCVTGSNIDVNKLKSKARMQHFFSSAQRKLYCDLVLYVV